MHSTELPPALAAAVRSHLDQIHGHDLAVSPRDVAALHADIGYQEVYSGPDLTLCIFLLRAGARLPLHDHPGMHVYGRLLFGRMRVQSFDFDAPSQSPRARFSATLHSDAVLGPTPTTYQLGPQEGNLHELEALEDSAFF